MRTPTLVLVALATFLLQMVLAAKFNDYHNQFCGKDDCYQLLEIPEDANSTVIRSAYKRLSKQWHPDKNKSPQAKVMFQKVAKAHQVLMNETHRQLYHRFQEYPDEYWLEYGHVFYSKYAPKTDTVFAVVLLLVVFSIFGPVAQNSKYKHACSFLITAAVKNWGLREGGTKETLEIRRRALEQVRANKEAKGSSSSSSSSSNGTAPTGGGGKDRKKDKKKVKEEEDAEFVKAVEAIVYGMEIKGGYRNWEWGDVLAVKLALLPVNLGKWAYFNARWWFVHSVQGQPLTHEEEVYLTKRAVGDVRWESLDESDDPAGDREDLVQQRVWESKEFAWAEWKEKREISRMNPAQLKKYLKDKKRREEVEQENDDEYDE